MLLLQASNVSKSYADRLIIHLDDFTIYTGDKIGLIGLNGSGKTTLLQLLTGELEPDIQSDSVIRRYCDITRIDQFGGAQSTPGAEKLSRYRVADKYGRTHISGGENTRLKLAAAFSGQPLLLFADEPTSNLDHQGISLFAEELQKVDSFILISHDRDVLRRHCNRIIEIADCRLKQYDGGFDFYVQQSEKDKQRAAFEYQQYADEKKRLQKVVAQKAKAAQSAFKKPNAKVERYADSGTARSKSSQQKNMQKATKAVETRLEKLQVKQKPRSVDAIALDFSLTNPPANKIVVEANRFSFAYGDNVLFDGAAFQVRNGAKVAVYAPNGAGKTTLLNSIARGADGIKAAPKARFGYFYQGFENLDMNVTVLQNVMRDSVQTETTARTVLARLLIKRDDVYKKAEVLSGGERIKLAFAKLMLSDANVLLLDEPTNYLDMTSIDALQSIVSEYQGTIIFVSHDRAFVNAVADTLLLIENGKILTFEGNIEQYHQRQNQKRNSSRNSDAILLQLKQSELLRSISRAKEIDKPALEAQYAEITRQLKLLNRSC